MMKHFKLLVILILLISSKSFAQSDTTRTMYVSDELSIEYNANESHFINKKKVLTEIIAKCNSVSGLSFTSIYMKLSDIPPEAPLSFELKLAAPVGIIVIDTAYMDNGAVALIEPYSFTIITVVIVPEGKTYCDIEKAIVNDPVLIDYLLLLKISKIPVSKEIEKIVNYEAVEELILVIEEVEASASAKRYFRRWLRNPTDKNWEKFTESVRASDIILFTMTVMTVTATVDQLKDTRAN